ncbi:hypothetical protein MNBD_GAMMA17-1062 [hydrothermal vent metagenome]|uniref:Uncharacterized protein n=1 Tax=hydrothermal vent metagenome TaxID=652676 RepID=A0A3B0ZQ43_9ZZZZ
MGNHRAQASKNSVTAKQEVKPSFRNVRRSLSGLPENYLSKNVADSHDKPVAVSLASGFFDFSSISIFPRSKTSVRQTSQALPIQAKLKIGQPNDKYEQEADRVADAVMRMPEPRIQQAPQADARYGGINAGFSASNADVVVQRQQEKEEELIQTKTLAQKISPLIQRQPDVENDDELILAKSTGEVTPSVAPAISTGIQSLQGGGQPLSRSERSFFDPRFGVDFSDVRVHNDSRAASLARSVNARAFTHGQDVVFGAGEYSPGLGQGRPLLAHELTHVVQQGGSNKIGFKASIESDPIDFRISERANVSHLQRSPLSDSVRDTHVADSSLEALLARLAQSDIQAAQNDPDVDAELIRILTSKPDDLWVAQQIRQGQLSETNLGINPSSSSSSPSAVQAHFFPGTTARRAVVVAGVHGNEVQGVEVADQLILTLQAGMAATPQLLPHFSVIVVPRLFPDNVAAGRRQRSTQTNRNFPNPGTTLATAPVNAAGRPLAEPATRAGRPRETPIARPILNENIMLMALMERFRPERIISIHGTRRPGAAGVFADPRHLNPAEENTVLGCAGVLGALPGWGVAPFQARKAICEQTAINNVQINDHELALRAAEEIDASTSGITGRTGPAGRQFNRAGESRAQSRAQQPARASHPSVAGNVGTSGNLDTTFWSGVSPAGVSLGEYASARGMSIFTVEPPLNCTAADYGPGGTCSGRAAAVSQTERSTELMSYAEVIRTVLLG